jgi:CheY-like chemotaxis protein
MYSGNFCFDKVIIIDDTDLDRYLAQCFIKKHHFANEVIEFELAKEALEFLKNNKNNFDGLRILILLDIRMPEMDGFEFLEESRELLEFMKENCFVIMLSSSIDENDYRRAEENPYVTKFMSKPLDGLKLQEIKKYCMPFPEENRA